MKNYFGYRFLMIVMLCLVLADLMQAQMSHLPYNSGFEKQTDTDWIFVKKGSSIPSEWCVGSADRKAGAKSMYISSDGGDATGYERTGLGYCVVAYRKFSGLSAGDYDLVFDCKAGGMSDASGAMKDGLRVAWIPAGNGVPDATSTGYNFPQYVTMYPVQSFDGRFEFYNIPWENIRSTVRVLPNETEYYLAFVWRTFGGNKSESFSLGACIDNVQLGFRSQDGCAKRPTNIRIEQAEDGSGHIVSWNGEASEYEFMYYQTNVKEEVEQTIKTDLTTCTYTIPLNSTPEGVYSLLVRSICNNDTSVWSELSDVFIYDASNHCLDYLNFYSDNVECTYGNFSDPYENKEVKNFGYQSINSLHTIHYRSDEYDIRTNNRLKTVPDGSIASVRIGSWMEANALSASVSYTYTVTEESDVLKLSYAAVLQYAALHPEEAQTRIIVEILDAETDTLLSECTKSDFNAKGVDQNVDNLRNWHRVEWTDLPSGTVQHKEPIMWCDWSVIGLNLEPYVGRALKIKITLQPCGANFHFAYAYFVLDCDKGEVDGVVCGEHPNRFTVPEGFVYEWYKTHDPERYVVGSENVLEITPFDTADYSVDLIFPENNSCYFTLNASALPREPIADMEYEIYYRNCNNVVKLKNNSRIFGFWGNDTIDTGELCKINLWDFGRYGISNDREPVIVIPAEGDTFVIILTTAMDKDFTCADTKEFTVFVPSIAVDTTVVKYEICDGIEVVHDGMTYMESGRVELHYSNSITGCDSIVILDISKIVTDYVFDTDTVCTGDLPYDFHGRKLTESGEYTHVVKSAIGCDSIVYTLDLIVEGSLVVEVDSVTVCTDDEFLFVSYNILDGMTTGCKIFYGDGAKSQNFVDMELPVEDIASGVLKIDMPDFVRPDRYDAEIVFYNSYCGEVVIPVIINVLYSSSVLVQRWNDVLAVTNKENNGGYVFSAYQWYRNGSRLVNQDASILYYLYADLDFEAEYSVLLTREDDGVSQFSCAFVPVRFNNDDMIDVPTVVFSKLMIEIKTEVAARAYLYGIGGHLVNVYDISVENNCLQMPDVEGMYILRIEYENGTITNSKFIIR